VHDILVDTEKFKVFLVQFNHAHELLLKLRFGTVDVSIVHLHRADAHQTKEFTRFFVAVARAIFGKAHEQVAVGTPL
jgi:hypothetical protein